MIASILVLNLNQDKWLELTDRTADAYFLLNILMCLKNVVKFSSEI